MSARDNLHTVKLNGKAISEGDLPRILSFCTDDIEILPALSDVVPWAHSWRGLKEAERFFQVLAEALEFQEYVMDEFIANDDSVVVIGHERCLVRSTKHMVEARWVQIFDFRDGRICRHREYTDTAAWNAAFTSQNSSH